MNFRITKKTICYLVSNRALADTLPVLIVFIAFILLVVSSYYGEL